MVRTTSGAASKSGGIVRRLNGRRTQRRDDRKFLLVQSGDGMEILRKNGAKIVFPAGDQRCRLARCWMNSDSIRPDQAESSITSIVLP